MTSCLNTFLNPPNKSQLDCAVTVPRQTQPEQYISVTGITHRGSRSDTRDTRGEGKTFHFPFVCLAHCATNPNHACFAVYDFILQDKLPARVRHENVSGNLSTLPKVKGIRDQHRSIQDPRLSWSPSPRKKLIVLSYVSPGGGKGYDLAGQIRRNALPRFPWGRVLTVPEYLLTVQALCNKTLIETNG